MFHRYLIFPLLWVTICAAQTESVLYTFTGESDGGVPYASLVMDKEGNLYGTTQQYGDGSCTFPYTGCGTIFELFPSMSGQWTYALLYTFQGGDDGANPSAGLTLDSAGNVYGTTFWGGVYGRGTVYELQRSQGWKETILHSFSGAADGGNPSGSVTLGPRGDIFGTTAYGGNKSCYLAGPGCGVVFELRRPNTNSQGWPEVVLHTFEETDGADPYVGVTLDAQGNVYGVTPFGGRGDGAYSGGLVFEVHLTETGWDYQIIHEFPSENGTPAGPVVLDSSGNLYGTTEMGGAFGSGSVFELKRSNLGAFWTEADIHSFSGPPDGWFPLFSGVVFDRAGNLFGMTQDGGASANCNSGCGAIFELQKNSSGAWEESDIFSFEGRTDGYYPFSGVIVGNSAELYGMTPQGGNPNCTAYGLSGCGIVFSLKLNSASF